MLLKSSEEKPCLFVSDIKLFYSQSKYNILYYKYNSITLFVYKFIRQAKLSYIYYINEDVGI